MRRWFVVVQLYAQAHWRDYPHDGRGNSFKYRRDAERVADELRKRYSDPQRWHVSVLRRRVRE